MTVGGSELKVLFDRAATKVWVNGIRYTHRGSPEIQIRVAPRIFLDEHYKEIHELIQSGMRPMKAYQTVAEKYDFDMDSLRKGYRKWYRKTYPEG